MAKIRRSQAPARRRVAAPAKPPARSARPVARRPSRAKATATPKAAPAGSALQYYESGLRALQGHDYPAARDAFAQVLAGFPDERDIVERASVYLKVCQRHLEKNPGSRALTIQERLAGATFALNAGQFAEAIGKARAVLELDQNSDHAHYVLALAHALNGDRTAAIQHLSRSIDINIDCRATALGELDFDSLKSEPAYKALLEPGSDAARRRAKMR